MNILFVASECAPFVKTGGLGDVMQTLPAALAKLGAKVSVMLPKYRDIPEVYKERMETAREFYVNLGWRSQYCGIRRLREAGVDYYFVDNEYYFARTSLYGRGDEEGERFGFFCRAVLEALPRLDFRPDVIHCNDWQTGMIPALHKMQYRRNSFYAGIKTVFTIHNLNYQGVFSWIYIDDILGIGERYFTQECLEYYGCVSYMKGGIVFADKVTTVSPSYAQEIQTPFFGERLEGLLRRRSGELSGILNGIDTKVDDPRKDKLIAGNYSEKDLSGKRACKAALQAELGLEPLSDPLVVLISRLNEQKGLDLVERVLDDIMRLGVQLAVLGKGDEHYQEFFSWAAWRYQGRLAARIEFNTALARRCYAGADMLLMPSRFEPCGIAQMVAMRYGTIPVVREVGGLKDTVRPYNQFDGTGNGFSFANYNAHEMLGALERAVGCYYDLPVWEGLMRRAMAADFSWDVSARQYLSLYAALTGLKIPETGRKKNTGEKAAGIRREETAASNSESEERHAKNK